MEGKKIQPRALLVFGAPCSGKSTFSKKFAKRFNLAFFDLEELQSKYHLSRKVILVFIEQIAKTGQTVLIEGCLNTERDREEVRHVLRSAGYLTSTIWIQTDIATIRSRLKLVTKALKRQKMPTIPWSPHLKLHQKQNHQSFSRVSIPLRPKLSTFLPA